MEIGVSGRLGLPSCFGELIGAFANNGTAVGQPVPTFPIGDFATLIVPPGANQLLLGTNDTLYFDNVSQYTLSH